MTAARGPRPAESAVSSTLTALVARLREAEIQPTAQELADALWLAGFAGPLTRPRPQAPEAAPPVVGGPGVKPPDPVDGAGPPPAERVPDQGAPGGRTTPSYEGRQADLFTPGPGTGGDGAGAPGGQDGMRVAAPAAATLPEPLALQRALRPLQHYRPPAHTAGSRLDEQATADRAADTGLILPVLKPDRRRQARLALLMDVSSSTVVWEQTFDELRQVCERAGAFREVQLHYLHEGADGGPRVGAGLAPGGHLADPSQFWDPAGRQLTLLLSDCAGPMWRSGQLHRLLYGWARTAPLAVVQPLPQRMWRSTHLPTRQGVLRRREGPAGRLEFRPRRPERGRDARGIPVPVLALRQSSFGAWARLVSGSTEQTMEAAVGRVRADQAPAAGSARAERTLTPAERVAAFRATASPDAAQLAACLSAAPLVLPVMQLVQRAMLVDSGPEVLAEVLLSGLLRVADEEGGGRDVVPGYAFLDGVREELFEHLGPGSAILVLKHCSEYVERRYGRTVRNFPALAAAVLAGSVDPGGSAPAGPSDDTRLRVFARVSAQVLRRFGRPDQFVRPGGADGAGSRELSDRARDCLDRFRSYGTVRDLDMGVQLLGAAVRGERRIAERAYLYGELAQALLLRWELRRLGEDLGEALSAVENALPHERRAHLTLARILEAMADEAESGRAGADEAWWLTAKAQVRAESGGEEGTEGTGGAAVLVERTAHEVALEFLNRAHNSLALIGGIPPASAAQRADWRAASLARVRVLRRLAELEPKWTGGCLDTAVQVTDALLKEDRTADVLLLRGSLLLALAHHAVAGPGEEALLTARAYADRAAKDLYAGFETPAPGALSDAEVSRAWLDVADAVELSQAETDDATRLTVLQALDQARRYAGPDREAQAVCLLRMAKVLRERYESTRSRTHLDSAVVAWSEALELMGPDDPRRAAAFTELGDALTARARAKESVDDARGAVRALRRALDETSESDPELARRRYLLGAAHVQRFHAEEVLPDLHEAHWILGAAARATDRSAVLARIWLLRAEVLRLLSERTGSPARLGEAADHALRAAEESRAAGEPLTEARARQLRALLLERTAGPARAREEHLEVLRILSDAAVAGRPDAEAEALSRAATDRLDGELGAS
ncbi:SAV_2336 N-terminal domain-related protein [Streptomyces melanogenes]|uniref:SAV_2336 family protein n=1 Tax=Streptomyces melanogenes TaxID=67326 RepID=A0ABZ1XP34_9ACTN|nr:SAV_2336 N-terminal domain-related protein [Streptomyces melanogenes]